MAFPLPSRRDDDKPGESRSGGSTGADKPGIPMWLAHLQPRDASDGEGSATSVTIELDRADYEALTRKARSDGKRVADVVRAAVQREIGNKPHVIALIRRWDLNREDLDSAADSLGVARLSDEEWSQISTRRSRRI
ncbi:hypothetical protein [Planomonospora parontospora]|uniref:hypothetical protein n=1 Tax=Planomonospora parontospora TaxID=58119 RepID=UPI00167058DA|nr:hypothetical protein [Planomonospora parontospora]GGL50352.1 hypothetical protein GCM10014719_59570 [Planomonospora parontospora subsp. antibiotica]GII18975.1 hypothetical protein Ppa05_57010 [Planomonospora parontospora subsp. antibiotica]